MDHGLRFVTCARSHFDSQHIGFNFVAATCDEPRRHFPAVRRRTKSVALGDMRHGMSQHTGKLRLVSGWEDETRGNHDVSTGKRQLFVSRPAPTGGDRQASAENPERRGVDHRCALMYVLDKTSAE